MVGNEMNIVLLFTINSNFKDYIMAKRLSLQEIRKIFEKENCKLLSKTYKNFHTKLKYKCSCGNISFIRLNNFIYGKSRCGCGKKGENHWCYGKHRTLKTKNLISERTKLGMTKKIRLNLSKKLKGKHNSPKTEFKKGNQPLHTNTKGIMKPNKTSYKKGQAGQTKGRKFAYHHIYLKENSAEKIKIPFKKHIKLHYQAYRYLVEIGKIDNYLKWFDKKYGLEL